MNSRSELERLTRAIYESLADIGPGGRRNMERIAAHFAPDVKYAIPFIPKEIHFESRDGFMSVIKATDGVFAKSIYSLNNFIIDVEKQTVVVEASSVRPLVKTGHEIKLRYVFIFEFRGDKVSKFREYAYTTDHHLIEEAMKLDSFETEATSA